MALLQHGLDAGAITGVAALVEVEDLDIRIAQQPPHHGPTNEASPPRSPTPCAGQTEGRMAAQSSPPGLENGLDRTEENHQIQPGAEVAQVIEVVAELDATIGHAVPIGIVDLSPAT